MDQLFIHRDLKPVNILLHFPDHKNLIYLAKDDKDISSRNRLETLENIGKVESFATFGRAGSITAGSTPPDNLLILVTNLLRLYLNICSSYVI